jgi:arylsulfatase
MSTRAVVPMRQAFTAVATVAAVLLGAGVAAAQQQPNIVVIMGDDIGIWNIGAYHRGMMAGRTVRLASPKH